MEFGGDRGNIVSGGFVMNLILHLTPETEVKLQEFVAATGMKPEELALEAIEEKLSRRPSSSRRLSVEEWTKRFDAWVATHRPHDRFVDDSRESIYEGRGE